MCGCALINAREHREIYRGKNVVCGVNVEIIAVAEIYKVSQCI
jgi:hypothetical protein